MLSPSEFKGLPIQKLAIRIYILNPTYRITEYFKLEKAVLIFHCGKSMHFKYILKNVIKNTKAVFLKCCSQILTQATKKNTTVTVYTSQATVMG